MARSSSATASLCRRRSRLPKDKGGRQLDAAPSCVLSSRRRRAVSTSTDLKRLTYLVKATPPTKKYRANHASQKTTLLVALRDPTRYSRLTTRRTSRPLGCRRGEPVSALCLEHGHAQRSHRRRKHTERPCCTVVSCGRVSGHERQNYRWQAGTE